MNRTGMILMVLLVVVLLISCNNGNSSHVNANFENVEPEAYNDVSSISDETLDDDLCVEIIPRLEFMAGVLSQTSWMDLLREI